ncbi:T9SS type A sorting domain-containing protein [Marivirga tractuosa]|uniref:T9SS type A sorting domain-containing protein n=1 Tax=Marivirga tractuosa TaxID=1006 RepID=UPI0035D00E9F
MSGSLIAQAPQERKCAAQIVHAQKLENDPIYKSRYEEIQRKTSEFQEQRKFARSALTTTVREIPVYVHIIYDETKPEQNLSDAQIESQIEVLNEDFRALNVDVSDVPAEFEGLVSDYQLIFTLEGITRKSSPVAEWDTNDEMKSNATGGVDPITPETHLNIWVCKISGDILGYAQFPGGSLDTDGVVVGPNYFGSSDYDADNNFYLSTPFDKGRTTTHEIGHYLNLIHIWGDGDCSADDEVSDTPIAFEPNYGCPNPSAPSCAENTTYSTDMFMNYMDYTNDACMFMFSEGQKTRSYALFEPGGVRENLGQQVDGCDLATPLYLEVTRRSTTSLGLRWDAVPEADSYTIWTNGIIITSSSNSIELTELESGNNYEIRVKANCLENGSGEYSDVLSVNTLGCFTAPLSFSITTDGYGAETSWELSLNGTVVQTDSITYDNNTTYTETFDFGDGDYKFEIFDSANDGICCGQTGDGSFSLTDSEGRIIKTGGEFGSKDSVSFCVETIEPIDCSSTTIATVGSNTADSAPALFEFEATEDKEYTISSIGTTTLDTDLSVYSDCNTLLAESDNFSDLQSEVTVVLNSGQKIYILWQDTHSTAGFDWEITRNKSTQSISFDDIPEKLVNDEPFDLTATASSGLEVSYTSSDQDVATISGNTVTILGAGETTITAIQEGNDEYLAAPVVQKVLRVNKLDQTINITPIDNKLTTDADFEVEAETSSGLPLSYEISGPASIAGTTISLNGSTGTVTIKVIQEGDEFYNSESASVSFQVEEDLCSDFSISEIIIDDISCSGEKDGQIEVNVVGGKSPYTYNLNDGSSVENNIWEGLSSGEYTIKVTDSNGCLDSMVATIKNPNPLEISAEVSNSNSVDGNGIIELTVSGGTGPYSYEWNNEADTSIIENLEVGIYTVIVTDENGCSLEESFEVTGVTATDKNIENELIIFPNPVRSKVSVIHPENSNELLIYDAKGKLILEMKIIGKKSEFDVNNFPTGLYFIRLPNDKRYYRFIKE